MIFLPTTDMKFSVERNVMSCHKALNSEFVINFKVTLLFSSEAIKYCYV